MDNSEISDCAEPSLRVSRNKGTSCFGIKGKLAPLYIGPFPITEKRSAVAYLLQLPENLARIHNVFHVSQLKKCFRPLIDVVISDTEQLEEDLSYPEYPVRILDQKDRVTRSRTITFYKVQWSNHTEDEATWEQEEFLKTNFPEFLTSQNR